MSSLSSWSRSATAKRSARPPKGKPSGGSTENCGGQLSLHASTGHPLGEPHPMLVSTATSGIAASTTGVTSASASLASLAATASASGCVPPSTAAAPAAPFTPAAPACPVGIEASVSPATAPSSELAMAYLTQRLEKQLSPALHVP